MSVGRVKERKGGRVTRDGAGAEEGALLLLNIPPPGGGGAGGGGPPNMLAGGGGGGGGGGAGMADSRFRFCGASRGLLIAAC